MAQQTDHVPDVRNMLTAVEWLIDQLKGYEYDGKDFTFHGVITSDLVEQAKQMENERRKEDFKIGYNQGYLDAQLNHVNDADNLAEERDYLQSQIDDVDKKIKEAQDKIASLLINGEKAGFKLGATWMKKQILNQNK